MKKTYHYINNKYIEGGTDTLIRKNPTTLDDFSTVVIGTDEEINLAVAAAKKSLPTWRNTPLEERIKTVEKIADWLEKEYGEEGEETELKSLIHNEIGKTLVEADIEVIESADFLRYFCREASKKLSEKEISIDVKLWPSKRSYHVIEPVGIVGVIKPWNYPLEMLIWTIAPALLTGNTLVLKPSEKSSLTGLKIAEAAKFAGIPPGVINIVTGDATTGKALVNHKDVSMISFTGSVKAGKNVASSCASSLKKCTLELGGNDHAIVASDADIELVSNGLVWGAFTNAGQVCVGVKQVLIEKSIANEVISSVLEKTNKLILGQDISPIVDEAQLSSALKAINDAKTKKATVLAGGARSKDHIGYYLLPTILTDLKSDMDLVMNECFAPLLPIRIVESLEEAIDIVNDSKYGLGASIWTKEINKANEVAKKLNVGMIWHNDVNIAFPSAPWGGRKLSGLGSELSPTAFEEYGCKKHICIENGSENTREWWYPY